MQKQNTKTILMRIAATTGIATLLTASIGNCLYMLISDMDRPESNPKDIEYMRDVANETFDNLHNEYCLQRDNAYRIASLSSEGRALDSLDNGLIQDYERSIELESRREEIEEKIAAEAEQLFETRLQFSKSILKADQLNSKANKRLYELEQDSIKAAKHDATPRYENFQRNWRTLKQTFSKTR
jgi:hypothetical protein